jgi:hypothetical protein
LTSHLNNKNNPHQVTATQVGAYTTEAVDQRLAPGSVALSVTGANTPSKVTITDLSPLAQQFIVKATKTNTSVDSQYNLTGGQQALWQLSTGTSGTTVYLNTDFGQFTDLLSNCSYEIIEQSDTGATICSTTNMYYPTNLISPMRYVYPGYTINTTGWSLNFDADEEGTKRMWMKEKESRQIFYSKACGDTSSSEDLKENYFAKGEFDDWK